MTVKRLIAGAVILGLLVVAAAVASVLALNQGVYSASGTVRWYLDALARGDSSSALAMPGVDQVSLTETERILLSSAAYSGPQNVRVETVSEGDDVATVVARYTLDEREYSSTFELERTPSVIFEEWGFVSSPLASLVVTVQHGTQFQVGRLGTVDIAAYPGGDASTFAGSATFPVFTGASYRVFRDRPLVRADSVTVPVTNVGETLDASITLEPTSEFLQQAEEGINSALDECVTQKVLMPTNCPFGYSTPNRFQGEPEWSMVTYPELAVTAAKESWIVAGTGTAHIVGSVKSLFDGSVAPVDEDRGFSLQIRAFVTEDGRVLELLP